MTTMIWGGGVGAGLEVERGGGGEAILTICNLYMYKSHLKKIIKLQVHNKINCKLHGQNM